MSDIKSVLQEFVATYNDPKVNGDITKTLSYFPELKGYDSKVLEEYVLTANDPIVKGDYEKDSPEATQETSQARVLPDMRFEAAG